MKPDYMIRYKLAPSYVPNGDETFNIGFSTLIKQGTLMKAMGDNGEFISITMNNNGK